MTARCDGGSLASSRKTSIFGERATRVACGKGETGSDGNGGGLWPRGERRKGEGMSESLTIEGWRVRADVAELVGTPFEEQYVEAPVPRQRYRRGALVRRSLLVADVMGLVLSFVLANALVRRAATTGDRVTPGFEYLAFLLAIPGWLLLLRLEGLYDRDEERTDHSTVDDIVGVFRSVTIGVWIFALFGVATNLVQPGARPARRLLARRGRPDPDPARRRADALPPPARLRAERRHRRRGTRRPAARPQADEPSRVRHQPRGLRRRSPDRARRRARAEAPAAARRTRPPSRMRHRSTGSSA